MSTLIDGAASVRPEGASVHAPQTFPVRFGERGPFGLGSQPLDSLRLIGAGELVLSADGVQVSGKRPRRFRSAVAETHAFAFDEISNVAASGTRLRFQIPSNESSSRFVVAELADAATALALLARLPDRKSAGFAADLAELTDFHQRLDALTRPARVTPALVALNAAMFIAMAIGGAGVIEPDGEIAIRWGTNYGPLTMGGEWWRLFTSTFIHFGLMHLLLNMWALYQTGAMTERLFGSGRFLLLYVFAGLTGSAASLLWNPSVNSAGASGAIFGVFGGLLAFVLNPRNGVPRSVMAEHRNSTLLFAGYSLVYGAVHPGIDNAAHIGGLVGGFLIGLLLAQPVDAVSRSGSGARRLSLAAGAGVLVLGLMLLPLARPSESTRNAQAYQSVLLGFSAREQLALEALREAETLANAERDFDAVRYKQVMGEKSFQAWNALYEQTAAPRLEAGTSEATQQAALLRYLDARRRYCRLMVEAVDDAAKLELARLADAEAQAAIDSLQ